MKNYFFTSESVTEGHPDKVADLISDNVANYLINQNESYSCLLYTSPSPRDGLLSRMPSSA